MTLVDSNVLIDALTNDPVWYRWSAERLDERARLGVLLINEIVYAELSVQIDTETELLGLLAIFDVELARIPTEALFIAGKTHHRYRAAGGIRTGVLPDFFIGAHASVTGIPLLTRDVRRFRTYFPDVQLITPE
jgi:predicted nucleic acid-binding protein